MPFVTPKSGDCTLVNIVQYPSHCYHRYEKCRLCSRPITHALVGGVSLFKTDRFLNKMCVTKAEYDEHGIFVVKNLTRNVMETHRSELML